MCEALAHAGIVLKIGDNVFLRPQDVIEMVMRVSHTLFHMTGLLHPGISPCAVFTNPNSLGNYHSCICISSQDLIKMVIEVVYANIPPFMISLKQLSAMALQGMLGMVHLIVLCACGLQTLRNTP